MICQIIHTLFWSAKQYYVVIELINENYYPVIIFLLFKIAVSMVIKGISKHSRSFTSVACKS